MRKVGWGWGVGGGRGGWGLGGLGVGIDDLQNAEENVSIFFPIDIDCVGPPDQA